MHIFRHQSRRSQMASLAHIVSLLIHWTFRFVRTKYIFLVIVCARKFPYKLKLETFCADKLRSCIPLLRTYNIVFHEFYGFIHSIFCYANAECKYSKLNGRLWLHEMIECSLSSYMYRTKSLIGILFFICFQLNSNSLWTLLK